MLDLVQNHFDPSFPVISRMSLVADILDDLNELFVDFESVPKNYLVEFKK